VANHVQEENSLRISLAGPARLLALVVVALALVGGLAGSASSARSAPTLTVGAIPDQDPQVLQRLYGVVSNYLSRKLHVNVVYKPVTDYTAAVTAFKVGDLQLVWFGGLTGVQARLQVPGTKLLAQRDIDASFHSVFIANTSSGLKPVATAAGLGELKGHTFTFGSQSSTSGYVMPEYFLHRAGVTDSAFRGQPGFSGSHDTTLALVTAGSYEAGVLNEQVWKKRLADGKVDTSKVQVILRTPGFHDYHWAARPDLDRTFGKNFTKRLRTVLLGIKGETAAQRSILALFGAGKFVPTAPSNYAEIEQIGKELGLIH
jgi:phosphonate transport system substrate-binding protein